MKRAPLALCLAASLLLVAGRGRAESPPPSFPAMAPLEQYLMADRAAEIALARSSAPPSVARNATVLVLGRDGYETAATGTNGFTCLVERSWTSAFDSVDFWNPQVRAPVCYNAAAVRSVLPYTLNRTRMVLQGVSKADMHARIVAAVAKHELVPPEVGAMSYMMAKDAYLGSEAKHWHPHVMFHIPTTDYATWGADLPGSPVLYDNGHVDNPEPQTVFMVLVAKYSDGTEAHAAH